MNGLFTLAVYTEKIAIGEALLLSLLGLGLVFLVLAFLSLIMFAMGKIVGAFQKKKAGTSETAAGTTAAAPDECIRQPLRLINVEERDAALIMAIVADDSGIPLEHLDFKSIRLITEDEQA